MHVKGGEKLLNSDSETTDSNKQQRHFSMGCVCRCNIRTPTSVASGGLFALSPVFFILFGIWNEQIGNFSSGDINQSDFHHLLVLIVYVD